MHWRLFWGREKRVGGGLPQVSGCRGIAIRSKKYRGPTYRLVRGVECRGPVPSLPPSTPSPPPLFPYLVNVWIVHSSRSFLMSRDIVIELLPPFLPPPSPPSYLPPRPQPQRPSCNRRPFAPPRGDPAHTIPARGAVAHHDLPGVGAH